NRQPTSNKYTEILQESHQYITTKYDTLRNHHLKFVPISGIRAATSARRTTSGIPRQPITTFNRPPKRVAASLQFLRKSCVRFGKLSSEFFSAENRRHHATELLLFAIFSGISAWPIISALLAVTRLPWTYWRGLS